jgi:hypothetical protein
MVAPFKVMENIGGLAAATPQAALGGNCKVSFVGGGLSISPMGLQKGREVAALPKLGEA